MAFELLPVHVRAVNALMSYFAYIAKIFWPSHLASFYPYPYSLPGPLALSAAVLGLLVSAVLAISAARNFPYVPVGWFWFLGTLVPVIGLVQVGSQWIADRYTYTPLIGLSVIVAWGAPDLVSRIPSQKSFLVLASGVAILVLAIVAGRQAQNWQNSIAMWSHDLDVTSNNYMAHYGLGAELGASGKHQEAAAHLQEALRINPGYTPAYFNLGVELADLGRLDEAGMQFSEAIRRDPGDAGAHNNLGNIFMAKGKLSEAAEQYRVALQISPDYVDARTNLAAVLVKQGGSALSNETGIATKSTKTDSKSTGNQSRN
jgi:tetratricopeptide (TPR) repeat protein